MTRMSEVMKDKSGTSTPLILCIVLACLILSTAIFEYARLMIVAQGVRDAVQEAVIDVATENWDDAYAGLREGYSGGYSLSGSTWYTNVTTGNIYARLKDVLGLKYESGQYVKYAGDKVEYSLYGLSVSVANAPLAPSDPNSISQLTVTGAMTVEVPLSFGWGQHPNLKLNIRFKSVYVPRF
ncbi:MAG TPA: hypothetical protein DEP23_03985 [Ruminococcaceae bacterium]|nr:hypothetical protein [Oscillospiraceae bacterium]